MRLTPLHVTAYTLSNALGRGKAAVFDSLTKGQSGLTHCDLESVNFSCWIGRVGGIEQEPVRKDLQHFDCRNNRLAQIGLEQDGFVGIIEGAIQRYGKARIGLFLGTSTSGIQETEHAYAKRDLITEALPSSFRYETTQNVNSLTDFCGRFLDIEGPALTISTACSSSSKVFATAYRFIDSGFCDAAVVGGVDSLCLTTLYGFHSLGLISEVACTPWGKTRTGISIGEAAGFALLERRAARPNIALLGYGESGDAYHMSSPHPEGKGAALAISKALERAGITADDLDYINLHGTGTQLNDISEDKALQQFDHHAGCSSTKGWTGHTLAAAGITEAAIAFLGLEQGLIPANINRGEADPELATAVVAENQWQSLKTVMSNSFGFGGTNCSLVFGKLD
ncbi:MAG: beta-ketoacyl-[acyl-carrier-protein] synthase family protein [Gammaproteobacteria bacterium]|nr:beta-ketoacyl-[acyl-carrier-protein] synthase family protein [Gammaproteobacteria bacterium]